MMLGCSCPLAFSLSPSLIDQNIKSSQTIWNFWYTYYRLAKLGHLITHNFDPVSVCSTKWPWETNNFSKTCADQMKILSNVKSYSKTRSNVHIALLLWYNSDLGSWKTVWTRLDHVNPLFHSHTLWTHSLKATNQKSTSPFSHGIIRTVFFSRIVNAYIS